MDKVLIGYFVTGNGDRYGEISFGELFMDIKTTRTELNYIRRYDGYTFVPVYINEEDLIHEHH